MRRVAGRGHIPHRPDAARPARALGELGKSVVRPVGPRVDRRLARLTPLLHAHVVGVRVEMLL